MSGALFSPRRPDARFGPTLAALRRTAAAVVAVALAAVVVAIVCGRLAGTAAAPKPPAVGAGERSARVGAAALSVPGRWAPARLAGTGLAGLDPRRTTVLSPSPGLSARVVVTLARVGDPSLLPAGLRSAIGGRPAAPRATRVAGHAAWLYSGLQLSGRWQMEVSVVPTSAGVLAVACIAPSFAWSAAVGCAQGVAAVRLAGATFFSPSPDLSFRLRLPGVIAALDRARVAGRDALRAAHTRPGQARAALALARAHAAAESAVAPLAGESGAALLTALHATVSAYGRLAAAASHGWPARYRLARRAVVRADARLADALRAAQA
jgi:hypothetical protein